MVMDVSWKMTFHALLQLLIFPCVVYAAYITSGVNYLHSTQSQEQE